MIGQATSYAKTSVRAETLNRQTVMSSVNDALNEVPGVVVSEADATGSSVWGTQISMRGFVTNRDTQQIGTTIDGLPNGGSGYGGGSLANRYIDTLDLETVEVSQGTADISSRSNEALGGTLNFLTSDPLQDSRLRFVVGAGDNEARKYYVRYDTGLLGGHTRAWVSASSARVHDWIDGGGKDQQRPHRRQVHHRTGPLDADRLPVLQRCRRAGIHQRLTEGLRHQSGS